MRIGSKSQHIDRRRFLLGAGGSMLALPMLQAFAPKAGFAADAAPPKRLVMLLHGHGRCIGNGYSSGGVPQDIWSPGSNTMALPTTGDISPLLAELGPVRNEIVTIDGVDNLVRHITGDGDGHYSASRTCLSCVPPNSDGTGGGPSIDYVAGQRLRASEAQRTALVFPASPPDYYADATFFGAGGTEPSVVDANPATALVDLFGAAQPTEPTTPTLQDRLLARRTSILDSVASSYQALTSQVGAADKDRLEQHASFIRALETRFAGGGPTELAQGCARPDETLIPTYTYQEATRGQLDSVVTPWQIENLVMSLACDVTRVASLNFQLTYDPTFAGEFDGPSPIDNWHTMIHDTPQITGANQPNLTQAFQYYGRMFTRLVQRLSEVTDTDGSRLLDNTLVVWVSDMGYGAAHYDFNNPVVLAGMGSAFGNGQGRHLVIPERRSLGDLYAQVLRMLGGSDTTFGTTGTLGDSGQSDLFAWASYNYAFAEPSLPLHLGELDL